MLLALVGTAIAAGALVLWNQPDSSETSDELAATSAIEDVQSENADRASDKADLELTDNGMSDLVASLPGRNEPVQEILIDRPDGQKATAQLAGSGKIPSSFPEDVPVYPEAQSAGGLSVGGEGAAVAFITPADGSEVYAYYTEALKAGGWLLDESLLAQPQQERISAMKDTRALWVTISHAPEGSQIFVALQESVATS